mgnify:CR=1 FL=1
MQVIVNISLKYGVLDPQGRAIGRSLTDLGFQEVGDVRVGKRITLEIDETDAGRARQRVARMCETLLANTVALVLSFLAVALGFDGVNDVRQGKFIELDLAETDEKAALAAADDMCRKLLANTVIEDYEIEIDEGEDA